jgi:HlyD family secretion protein
MGNKIKKLLQTILFFLFLCFTILFLTACSNEGNSKIFGQKQKTVQVKIGSITNKLQLSGTIVPSKLFEIKSKISGEVDELIFEVGDSVKVGDIIAYLNPDPKISLDILKKDLNLWKKQLEFKKQERLFNEKVELFKKGLISDEEYQDTRFDYRILKKELEILKVDVSIFKNENGFDDSSSGNAVLQRAKVSSPTDGTILQIPVQPGDFVRSALSQYGEGTVICTIGNLKEYLVELSVTEYDLHKIKTGQQVVISLNDKPEIDDGIVMKISPIGNFTNSPVTFDVKIQFTPQNLECFPGMSANVDIVLSKKENILILPIETVLFKKNKGTVVISGPDGPKIQKIMIGITDNQSVEIVSGLEENMEVFTNPKMMIKDIALKK